jgi:peptidoglycan/xylan/chitin deacetylase (PgdA/CDA1 family)
VNSGERRRRREASRAAARGRRRRAVGALAAVLAAAGLGVFAATRGGGAGAHRLAAPGTAASSTRSGTGAAGTAAGGVSTSASAAKGATTSVPGAAAGSAAGIPGATASAPGATTPVPILMYHVIAAPPQGAPFPGLYVTPSDFASQMHALSAAGWRATTLDQLYASWHGGAQLGPGRPIVLTFDNGYQSQYTQALPVLRRLGWVADENIQLSGLPPSQGGLGEAEVRELIAAGWELDTQGISHADLVALDGEQLHYQVAVAREQLRARYRVPVNWFCYPSGHYNPTVVAAVRSAGFRGSTTVIPGWAHAGDDPFRLHRLRVLGGTSPSALLAQIAGARGELSAPQSYGS